MKKIFRTFLSLMLIMCIMPIGISAEENTYQDSIDEYVYIDDEGNEHRYFDGNGNPIKIEDLENFNQKKFTTYNEILRGPVGPPDSIFITSSNTIQGARQKVTSDFRGPVTITYAESYTSSGSITVGLSASVEARIFTKIKVEINGSIAWSSSSQTSFSASYNVPANKIGAIYFTPYLSRSSVTYYDSNGDGTLVTATFPITTAAGYTDGLYELITRDA